MKIKREDMASMKKMIFRLIEWLEKAGHSPKEVLDCIKYLTILSAFLGFSVIFYPHIFN